MKLVVLILLLLPVLSITAQNKIREGNFERGLSSWETHVVDESYKEAEKPTATADLTAINPGLNGSKSALYAEVIQPGKYDWYISATGKASLIKNTSYELTFRAKASLKRNITVALYSDINSDSTFFLESIVIGVEEKVYGPFKMYYEESPVKPGIRFLFGGEEGNVTIDDVYLKEVPTIITIETSNSLEDVIGDITLPHEGLPHGVWDKYDWGKKPREGAKAPPDDWTAAIAWGQLYEWVNGNPAKNTRVQIRDLAMFHLSKTDSMWHELQSAVLVEGAAYVEDFVGDVSKPADIRNEPDGSISVTAGDGYNFHFWPSTGRVEIPKGDVTGCFITVNARLILDDPNGVDDRDSARYLMGVGGDWWESLSAQWDNWTTNWDMGIGRFRFVTKEWQGFNLITLSPEQTRQFPPPLPYVTAIRNEIKLNPNRYTSLKNYPNPVYHNTIIEYNIKNPTKVKLELFNTEGKSIKILVDQYQEAGTYKINFDSSAYKAGVYFYSISADNYKETQKMLLVK